MFALPVLCPNSPSHPLEEARRGVKGTEGTRLSPSEQIRNGSYGSNPANGSRMVPDHAFR